MNSRLFRAGRLQIVIDALYPLEQARSARGKTVIRVAR